MGKITDSTTTLETTWTEQSISEFKAGVLTAIAGCVSEVEAKLNRGTLGASSKPSDAQVKNWLKRAKLELAAERGYTFNRKYAYCDTTADSYRYGLPDDYNGGPTRLKDTTNNRYITLYDGSHADHIYPDPSEETSDEIEFAVIRNMELWLYPPAGGTYRLEMEYQRSGAETTADDFDWIPEHERYLCCDFAVAEAFEALHQLQFADRYRQKWEYGLARSRRADGRRKWQGKTLRVRSVFEEASNKSYQPNKWNYV